MKKRSRKSANFLGQINTVDSLNLCDVGDISLRLGRLQTEWRSE
jgi:hypothetical protein